MKKKIFKVFILVIICTSSCTKQPECTSFIAKQAALELTEELIAADLAFEEFVTEERYNLLLDMKTEAKLLAMKEEIRLELRNRLQIVEVDSTLYTYYVLNAIKTFESLDPKLGSVRMSDINKEIRKCSCAGELILNNGNTVSLDYTVQETEEGETYVEVQIIE